MHKLLFQIRTLSVGLQRGELTYSRQIRPVIFKSSEVLATRVDENVPSSIRRVEDLAK